MWIKWLQEVGQGEGQSVGTKATHLGIISNKGISIIPGYCITSSAYEEFIAYNNLKDKIEKEISYIDYNDKSEIEKKSKIIQSLIIKGDYPLPLKNSILKYYKELIAIPPYGTLVSVRSSSTYEDLTDNSFAGLYDTFLNISGEENILFYIKKCFASIWSSRAIEYRHHFNFSQINVKMAVIIQKMFPIEVSGIIFTQHPSNKYKREIVINSNWGLCDSIVSGKVTPDTFILSKSIFNRLKIKEKIIAEKDFMSDSSCENNCETKLISVPEEKRRKPSLSEDNLIKLGKLGLKIEKIFKAPQDIEWCLSNGKFYILQSRPITTDKSNLTFSSNNFIIWTQRFSGERWNQPVSQLGWSIMKDILHYFTYFENTSKRFLNRTLPTKVVGGYIYFNITILQKFIFKIYNFLFPEFILELLPDSEVRRISSKKIILPSLSFLLTILYDIIKFKLWRRYDWSIFNNYINWQKFLPYFTSKLEKIEKDLINDNSNKNCFFLIEEAKKLAISYIRIHIMTLAYANIFYQFLGELLKLWGNDKEDKLRLSIVAGYGNKTIEMNKELWRLSELIKNDNNILSIFLSESNYDEILNNVKKLYPSSPFIKEFEIFINQYGARSSASWELFCQRWAENPSCIINILKSYITSDSVNPFEKEKEIIEEQKLALDKIKFELSKSFIDKIFPIKFKVFERILEYCKIYMSTRENQRFYFDKLVFTMKKILDTISYNLKNQGKLKNSVDATFLTYDELVSYEKGDLSSKKISTIIKERKEAYKLALNILPPTFFINDSPYYEGEIDKLKVLKGIGVSPGKVTGRVKIINNFDDACNLLSEEILVTKGADPGWTPLFLSVGGVIMELGSLLSHGAVIAREYNLPAVVNVNRATSILRDGQIVTIDGSEGFVYLHS